MPAADEEQLVRIANFPNSPIDSCYWIWAPPCRRCEADYIDCSPAIARRYSLPVSDISGMAAALSGAEDV